MMHRRPKKKCKFGRRKDGLCRKRRRARRAPRKKRGLFAWLFGR